MANEIKILCVDDEQNVLSSMRRLFLDEEYEILTALSGLEGIELLEREETVPVVVADYRMPRMDGVEFLREVARRWPETVRLVLSGYADLAAVVSAINEGQIYKFIPKPWNDEELKLAVAQAVDVFTQQQARREMVAALTQNSEACGRWLQEKDLELVAQREACRATEGVVEALSCGVLVVDEHGDVVRCNRRCRELFVPVGRDPASRAASPLPAELLSLLATLRDDGSLATFALHGRDLQVRWRLLPPAAEERGGRWLIEFWEGVVGQ